MKWVRLDIELPKDDFVTMIKLDGKKLCLVKHQNKLHVLQNSCPHAGGLLSGGWCKSGNIICPIHRYEYNLETGKGAAGQNDYIDVYPTEEREDGIYVGLPDGFWKRLFS
ncbi:Rieske (2Fe-2S) protein [Pedobacter xixiisoli]|uniref:3-phenylpropionate/trans-cinnamate dioxygenase ferredoxin subunit n=1 Tax=Pedobacter xixiisoli TaxID=1476464 RepID=A0A285ZTE7_9SPHI|nr:Rieske (2Fe-2S) protein [Pedobacter xixiisoli]SOD12918.1 3-phenylpropionate/trans-cinnamate dioxygenase ferredoxin subunit [Pedobacter xixiisoli]